MGSIWWIVLLFILFGGGVSNFIRTEINRRHERKRELTYGPRPVCGCGHHYSFHNAKTGLCMHGGRVATKWDECGEPVKWEMKQCGCQRYVGPQPLDSLYAPEITTSYVSEEE